MRTSIDVITHEKIVWLRYLPSDLEKLHKIVELPMNISTNDNWCSYWDHVRFLSQDLFCLSLTTLTFSHNSFTSASGSGLHVRISSICLSRFEYYVIGFMAWINYDPFKNHNLDAKHMFRSQRNSHLCFDKFRDKMLFLCILTFQGW